MSSTTLRREGDTVFLEHKYYGRFQFRHAGALCDGSAATAEVFAGERTDGEEPRRVALKFDTGGQVYSDHMHWRNLYYSEQQRFPGLPWILRQTIPEVPWGPDGRKTDVMVSQLMGDSLEAVRLRRPSRALPPRAVCCVAIQTLDMLAAIHAAGVVHRDIKPANLLLPLEATPPQQLHVIDFGVAGKIDARGAAESQNADGTALYSHRGAVLRHPVSFRDDLEALGYSMLMLAAGTLPWEARALETVPKKAADARAKDVAKLKATQLAAGVAAVAAPPLAEALRRYFSALGLGSVADNAARFDYAALRAGFERAYGALAGAPYAHGLDWAEEGGEAGAVSSSPGASPGRKRARPAAAVEAEEEAPAPKRGKAAAAAKKKAAPPKKKSALPQPAGGGRVTRARAGAAAK